MVTMLERGASRSPHRRRPPRRHTLPAA